MSTAAEESHPPVAHYDPPPKLDEAIHAVPLVEASKTPKRVGYLTNYSFHIWYQIVIEVKKKEVMGGFTPRARGQAADPRKNPPALARQRPESGDDRRMAMWSKVARPITAQIMLTAADG